MISRMVASLAAIAWLALATVIPSRASAQDRSFEARVDGPMLELVAPVLEAAERDSLPVDALRAKVLEGAAKNRPPQLVAQVVGRLADDFRTTRAELRQLLPDASIAAEELVAAAFARQQSVPVESVADLWAARPPGQRLEIPLTVLAELVRRGVPAAEASALMRHVLSTGVPLERAALIPGRFDGAANPGVAPPEALERALRDLDIPPPPGSPGAPEPRPFPGVIGD
jgi:hypothetical protein